MITRLTGINQHMVAKAPSIYSQRSRLKKLIADHVVVGHNVGFDLGFLNAESIAMGAHRVDTIALASILLPGAGRYGLNSLSQLLDLPREKSIQSHRALEDAQLTTELFLHLFEKAKELDFTVLSEIVEAGRQLGWPETIFFEEALRVVGREAFGRSKGQLPRLFKPEKLSGRPLVPADNLTAIDTELLIDMLSPGGNFSRHFPAFEYREQQVEMLAAVAEAFNAGQHLVVEAGTGTGKSVGYLLPAVFWATQNGRRVVVSTNTINLQDQLVEKDLPELSHIVPFEVRSAILKGKRNYLCTRLFQQMRHSGPSNADEMILYGRILAWLPHSDSGDISGISLRTQGERLAWAKLSAENDVCTAEKCAQEGCPLHYARRRAELAHMLVVNHA
jgi:DNA polymerase-3 subunit epsilon/ATP-dependent DNA helicase DinG